ncbi:MAG TPA: SpoIIIAH-like family protein [Candidatus Scatavimonas merdigallinarum]|uniref:SpoIIIAH-like family protein n=1 Tax=Candidatus Scatavimonas merdigallinarum TaxID=2840914 RepID=A0A9D0ZGN9_9FIRM|nr:SpoIIIAH-like family protein [Candidatus Scatavimonas merdigallinarum]
MKFGKRQLVLAALVVALGAAVYLNWQFAGNEDLLTATTSSTAKELGQAQFVNNSTDKTADKEEKESSESSKKQESTVKANEDSLAYFAQSKVERQKTQDEITDLAKEVIEAASSSEEAKAEAVAQAAEIAKIMEQQTNIESLIKAKGFTECFAFIQNGECSVVVCKGELSDDKVIVIKDIVNGQSGIEFENIKITEA